MDITTTLVNELLPDLTDGASRVLVGPVARDLFGCTSSVGHRTYAYGGHYWTGVETYDGAELCSDDCLTRWAAEHMPGAVELMTDVEFGWQGYEVRTFLIPGDPEDGAHAIDAVAYPFTYSDHRPDDGSVTCDVCDRVIVGGPTFRQYVSDFFGAYLECAVWSSHDWSVVDDVEVHNPEPLDKNYSVDDISDDTLSELLADVVAFIGAEWSDLQSLDAEQSGHDFWLTRNGHGAGFWDRGLGDVGTRLTDACRPYGEVDLYVGDDGAIYC